MRSWLNRTVIGVGLTSFLADVGYEMAAALFPGFVIALSLQAAPAIVGLIEGLADFLSNFAKLGSGWMGDRIGRRKPFVVAGYVISGGAYGLWTLATGWPLLLTAKVVAWFGKGVRGPLRNAILAEAVPAKDRGKAFGLHRAADTVGAVVGPLLGAALLRFLQPRYSDDPSAPFRVIFLLTLIPGLASAVTFAVLVRERSRTSDSRPTSFSAALRQFPRGFRRYLIGVGIFGLGDCSRILIMLAAATLLAPAYGPAHAAELAALLYAWHNACQAITSFPVGWLSDHIGRRGLLVAGYALGAIVSASLAVAFLSGAGLPLLALICCGSGMYVAIEEALEGAMTADLVPDLSIRGTAYGVLGVVNGAGDFAASALVGGLWTIAPQLGFTYSAGMMLLGALALARWTKAD